MTELANDSATVGTTVNFQTLGPSAWMPDASVTSRSRLLAAIAEWGLGSIEELHATAIAHPGWFWRAVVEDLGIDFDTPFEQVVDDSAGKPFPSWFTGGRINAATLCSHRHAVGPHANKTAVVYEGDDGRRTSLTYAELDREVRRFAANLTAMGVGRGDRIVLFLPVVPEAVVAFLGAAMVGAITVPAFTGYGAEALAMRLRDSEAVLLVTADGTTTTVNVACVGRMLSLEMPNGPLRFVKFQ